MATQSRPTPELIPAQPSPELALANERIDLLERAVQSHGKVGQALGILMARYSIGEDPAFAAVLRVSQEHKIKLGALSEAVVKSVTSPGTPLPRELTSALEELLRAGEAPRTGTST